MQWRERGEGGGLKKGWAGRRAEESATCGIGDRLREIFCIVLMGVFKFPHLLLCTHVGANAILWLIELRTQGLHESSEAKLQLMTLLI